MENRNSVWSMALMLLVAALLGGLLSCTSGNQEDKKDIRYLKQDSGFLDSVEVIEKDAVKHRASVVGQLRDSTSPIFHRTLPTARPLLEYPRISSAPPPPETGNQDPLQAALDGLK